MAKHWIQTRSGKKFDPFEPDPAQIDIEDIAHALSNQCRFTGHTRRFYSVAEHSYWVSYVCDPADALAGLLHDASEAYLCDIASPVKSRPEFDGYRVAEHRLQSVIYERFGLAPEMPASVKVADARMLVTEAQELMWPLHEDWNIRAIAEPAAVWPSGFQPTIARDAFSARFVDLGGKR